MQGSQQYTTGGMEQEQYPTQMGQQYGQGQQVGTGMQTGSTTQGWTGQTVGQGQAIEQGQLPREARKISTSIAQAIDVCGWCADQCIAESNPHMVECIRLCEDVTELGETLLALLPRNSRFTQDVAWTFQQAIQECAQECSRHEAPHCQDCARVLDNVYDSTQQLVGTGQSTYQQPMG